MEDLKKQCFQIISAIGVIHPSYVEVIQEAEKANFEGAREMIEEGDKNPLRGHKTHAKMIQQEAGGEKVETGLLLIHTEDQLMSAENFKTIADEMIQSYERITALESKIK